MQKTGIYIRRTMAGEYGDKDVTLQQAYEEMQKRGWGFASNGYGFGDPRATMTAVGPYDGVLVEVLAMDPDPIKAVEKAIQRESGKDALPDLR